MLTPVDKARTNRLPSTTNTAIQKMGGGAPINTVCIDNRPEAVVQQKLQGIASSGPQAAQSRTFPEIANNSQQAKKAFEWQAIADAHHPEPHSLIRNKKNSTDPSDNLKTEIDAPSSHSTNHTMAHYNLLQPAQLNASTIQKASSKKKQKPKHKPKTKKTPSPKKQTMTVRNKINSYTSGLINSLSLPTGVEKGPRAEAQKVQSFFGGSWVGGHMVNDQLGGSGNFKNIVPITSSMNGLHRSMENKANNFLSAGHGASIEYKMQILKRATVTNGVKTVKNLPIEFKQTLDVHPSSAPMYTITGKNLQESSPGNGKIKP
ncbi:DNA/RNA non-specific endonuclease [Oryzomicrobium sp.]|uniref:DNA/RNA non-specific endonuclease n=1 Tax=Oryzomicrobium sp. TaxID=1911578 RepID=UPI002FE28974